jgi:hypothetical protein
MQLSRLSAGLVSLVAIIANSFGLRKHFFPAGAQKNPAEFHSLSQQNAQFGNIWRQRPRALSPCQKSLAEFATRTPRKQSNHFFCR